MESERVFSWLSCNLWLNYKFIPQYLRVTLWNPLPPNLWRTEISDCIFRLTQTLVCFVGTTRKILVEQKNPQVTRASDSNQSISGCCFFLVGYMGYYLREIFGGILDTQYTPDVSSSRISKGFSNKSTRGPKKVAKFYFSPQVCCCQVLESFHTTWWLLYYQTFLEKI